MIIREKPIEMIHSRYLFFFHIALELYGFFSFLLCEKNSFVKTQYNDSFSFDFCRLKHHSGKKFIYQRCSQVGKGIISIKECTPFPLKIEIQTNQCPQVQFSKNFQPSRVSMRWNCSILLVQHSTPLISQTKIFGIS